MSDGDIWNARTHEFDIDADKVTALQNGAIPIYEPGLEVFFDRGVREGRLTFTTELAGAVETTDVVFLALPTPPAEDGCREGHFD